MLQIPKFNAYGHCDEPAINVQRQLYNLQNNWNHAVECVFSGIAEFPYNIIEKFSKREKEEYQKEKEQICIPYSKLTEEEQEEILTKNSYKRNL